MSFNALNFFFAQVDLAWLIVVPVLCIAAAGCGGWLVTRFVLNKKIGKAKNVAQSIVDEAKIEAKTLKKEAILEAKEEVLKLKQDFDKESKERRNEIQKQEFRLIQKEEALDKKEDVLSKKNEHLDQQIKSVQNHQN